jgi:heme/copper-type cytochrome/quinol oxidase subunit 3
LQKRREKMVKKGLWLFLAVAAMVFGLAFGAMAEEGVTDTEIHIGQWGPQTGPAAPWGAVARGTGVYFDMINAQDRTGSALGCSCPWHRCLF